MRLCIVDLESVASTDRTVVGGKAARLAELRARGWHVPPGFVITADAYRAQAGRLGADAVPETDRMRLLLDAPLDTELAETIARAHLALGASTVAVRSSAVQEDGVDASFAGQFDTVLDVADIDAVLAAVRRCWSSLWSPRAVGYRTGSSPDAAMAVLVQPMVRAEMAGVAFTADPVSGRRDRLVIEAVRGCGNALVDGADPHFRAVVDRGTGATVGPCTLPTPIVAELTRVAARAEAELCAPQDIEWAVEDGTLQVLQCRPITALAPEPAAAAAPVAGGRRARALLMAAEHAPVPPYPMDASLFLRSAVRAAIGGLSRAGFAVPAESEMLQGVDDAVIRIVPPRPRPTPRLALRLPVLVPQLLAQVAGARPRTWLERCEREYLPVVRAVDAEDLTRLTDDDLVARMETLRRAQGAMFPSRFACFPKGRLCDALLRRLLSRVAGPVQAPSLYADLMAGLPCITRSANAALARLAEIVRATPELAETYRTSPATAVAERLAETTEGRDLIAAIEDYLSCYGLWKTSTASVGIPALRETPEVLHTQLAGLVGSRRREHQDQHARAAGARTRLTGHRRWVTARAALALVGPAREFAAFREDSHYHLFSAFAVMRRLVLELGARMVRRGLLDHAEDVVLLELDEARTLDAPALAGIVVRRRASREKRLPDYQRIAVDLGDTGPGGRVHGTPASRGYASGRVCVVNNEQEFGKLADGDILVCGYTNPSWTPLFSIASAVVVDTGGLTSHSAIVAREHGIPAVLGTGNATRTFVDGQWVRVNGDRGVVETVASAPRTTA